MVLVKRTAAVAFVLLQCMLARNIATKYATDGQSNIVHFTGLIILLLLLSDITLYVLWRCLVRPRFSTLRDLPQPPPPTNPLTGHLTAVFSTPLGRQITTWLSTIPNAGLLYFRGALGSEYLVVAAPEGLRDVLFTRAYDFEKTRGFRRYTRRFLAAGLVVQEGEAHKVWRRAVGPVFQAKNVEGLKPVLCEKARGLVRVLLERAGGEEAVVEICDWATRFALDVACVVGFGEDFGLVGGRGVHPVLKAYTTVFAGSEEKMGHYAWHNSAPVWLSSMFPHKLDKEMDEASRVIRELTLSAVEKRMGLIEKGEKAPQDFLTEVILSGKFDAQECADELVILMAAAHESTAALIPMTIHRLSQHSSLQSALREELSVFGLHADQKSSIPETHYEKMTMLNAILNEMMRLEPPLPLTLRKTVRDAIVGSHAVKAGTYIVISPYAMGRSPAIWGPSASKFDPYRWIVPSEQAEKALVRSPSSEAPTEGKPTRARADEIRSPHGTFNEHGGSLGNHQYGMLTFLKGPKGCTGERFAKAEMRRVIAALVAGFEWTSAQEHEPEQIGIVVVKPAGGIAVRMRPITPIQG